VGYRARENNNNNNAVDIAVSIALINEIVDIVISPVLINEVLVLDCEQISYIKTQGQTFFVHIYIIHNTKVVLGVHAFIRQYSNIKRKMYKYNANI
jgi:hypothetical protein